MSTPEPGAGAVSARPLRGPGSPTAARILSAAADLFVAGAYADVTVDQVAEAADLTKGAIYHHFRTKEALYVAMVQRDFAHKGRLFRRAVAFEGPCRDRLRALTGAFLALPATERLLMQLVRRDAKSFPEEVRRDLVRAYQDALPAIVEDVVRSGIRVGEIVSADPRLLAWQFIATVEVLLTPYAEQRFASDEEKLDHVMNSFFHGCARTPCAAMPAASPTPPTEEAGR